MKEHATQALPASQRKATASIFADDVNSVIICAEKPDLNVAKDAFLRFVESAPNNLREDLTNLWSLNKELNRDSFNRSIRDLRGRLDARLAETPWKPDDEALRQLTAFRMTDAEPSPASDAWQDILENKIRSVRFCQVRSVAKKGVDLYGTRHFNSYFYDAKGHSARMILANETIAVKPLTSQAELIVSRTLERRNAESSQEETPSNETLRPSSNVTDPLAYSPARAGLVVSFIRPAKDYKRKENNYNFLLAAYEASLLKEVNRAAEKLPETPVTAEIVPVMLENVTGRTDATALERIFSQPRFSHPKGNIQNAIIIDDHVNAGGFAASLMSQLEHSGINVLGTFSHSRHPDSRRIVVSEEVKATLLTLAPENELNLTLKPYGLSAETLTDREAMTLIAYLSDGRSTEQVRRFGELSAELRGEYANIAEGINDNLETILREPAISVTQLKNDMSRQSSVRF